MYKYKSIFGQFDFSYFLMILVLVNDNNPVSRRKNDDWSGEHGFCWVPATLLTLSSAASSSLSASRAFSTRASRALSDSSRLTIFSRSPTNMRYFSLSLGLQRSWTKASMLSPRAVKRFCCSESPSLSPCSDRRLTRSACNSSTCSTTHSTAPSANNEERLCAQISLHEYNLNPVWEYKQCNTTWPHSKQANNIKNIYNIIQNVQKWPKHVYINLKY